MNKLKHNSKANLIDQAAYRPRRQGAPDYLFLGEKKPDTARTEEAIARDRARRKVALIADARELGAEMLEVWE